MQYLFLLLSVSFTLLFTVGLGRAALRLSPRIGATLLGVILGGALCSVPELCLSVSFASSREGDLSLALLLGANVCNLTVLCGASFLVGSLSCDGTGLLGAAFSLLLYAFVLGALLFPGEFGSFALAWGASLVLVGVYGLGVLLLYRHDSSSRRARRAARSRLRARNAPKAFRGIALYGAATAIASSSAAFAGYSFLSERDAGALDGVFLSMVTSLPEMTLVLWSVRGRKPEIGVGGVFGANMTNLLLIAVADLAYPASPLLGDLMLPRVLLLLLVEGIFLTSLAIISLIYKKSQRAGCRSRPLLV